MNYSAVLQLVGHRLGICLSADSLQDPKPSVAARGFSSPRIKPWLK